MYDCRSLWLQALWSRLVEQQKENQNVRFAMVYFLTYEQWQHITQPFQSHIFVIKFMLLLNFIVFLVRLLKNILLSHYQYFFRFMYVHNTFIFVMMSGYIISIYFCILLKYVYSLNSLQFMFILAPWDIFILLFCTSKNGVT